MRGVRGKTSPRILAVSPRAPAAAGPGTAASVPVVHWSAGRHGRAFGARQRSGGRPEALGAFLDGERTRRAQMAALLARREALAHDETAAAGAAAEPQQVAAGERAHQ